MVASTSLLDTQNGAVSPPETSDPALRLVAPTIPAQIGQYEVGNILGRGGMGEVYAARDIRTGGAVAIKILRPALIFDDEAMERFRRESTHASSLRGPHSVRVHEVGQASNGLPYIVMELLTGTDLDALIEQGPLSLRSAVRWTLEACEAVAEAHARGFIHRDLKPANLFVAQGPNGQILKVLDYGISKAAQSPRLTATQGAVGTPIYMSPEQAKNSKEVDHRTDIWSLGVILYELLTGHIPFTGKSPTEIAIQVCTAEPLRPSSLRPEIPPELEKVVLQTLEKDPAKRPADITALAMLLRAVRLPRALDESAPSLAVSRPAPKAPANRRRVLAAVGAALTGSLLLALLLGANGGGDKAEAAAGESPTAEPQIAAALVATTRTTELVPASMDTNMELPAQPAQPAPVESEVPAPSAQEPAKRVEAVPSSVKAGPQKSAAPAASHMVGPPKRPRPKFDERL